MTYSEQAVQFDCEHDEVVGVVSIPVTARELGVVVVVGGPQYRVGSHRQFVQMARRLACEGYAVLRFDYRGMGDSEGEQRNFEHVDADVHAAIGALQRICPTVRRVVLWGLCDGASASLLYLDGAEPDPRVAGLCLLNPWIRTDATLARTHVKHYYLQRLRQYDFWRKLLRGDIAGVAARGLFRNLAAAINRPGLDQSVPKLYTHRMARSCSHFAGPILLALSEQDFTAKEFLQVLDSDPAWAEVPRRKSLKRLSLKDTDHTLSSRVAGRAMETGLLHWLSSAFSGGVEPVQSARTTALQEEFHVL